MTASPLFWRGSYHVRIIGNGTDTKRRIPSEAFGGVLCDRKTRRGDRIARKYADEMESDGAAVGLQAIGRGSDFTAERLPLAKSRNGRASAAAASPDSMSLAQIGALFLSRNRGTLDPKTLKRYAQIITNLADYFGDLRPDLVHVGELERYRDKRLADQWTPRLGKVGRRQISPRTVWGELTFAVQLLGFGFDRAIETGMTSLPVRKAPDVADRSRTRGRALSIEEFWRAYEAAGVLPRVADRYQRMLVLGLTTMLREEPLLNLSHEWTDLTARTVTIPPQFVKKGRGRARKELVLPLGAWTVTALQDGTSCVWGTPIANVQPTLVRIARLAGIRPFSLHDLRRTGATLLLNHRCDRHPQGVPKFTVDRLLGHAMPLLDEAYYSVGMNALRDAVSVFDEEWDKRRGVDGVDVVAIGRKLQ